MIDAAHERKSECLSMVFLDWAKAFDRIRGDSLLKALSRFGLPEHVVKMIGSIYAERQFSYKITVVLHPFFNNMQVSRKDAHYHPFYS